MEKGLVIKTTGSWHFVKSGRNVFNCKLKGTFRVRNIRNTNPVAVGDHVFFEITGKDSGIINGIEARTNYIIRKATNLARESQILAANVDQLILMITLKYPETPLEFIDRFLLTAEAYHIKSILVINKTDLYNKENLIWLDEFIKIYEFADYRCIKLSLKDNKETGSMIPLLKDKISIIAGNSGVGKTTLINALCPGLNLKTKEISSYHLAGKHATTYPEMIELPFGGYVIDTPGIRGFGIIDLNKNEIGLYFNDIFKLSKNCQFYNCTHLHEPNCAVLEACKSGLLHESRYKSYANIFLDNNEKYRTG
ncbi:MAG: ribosome small subunit-dependent GTPase A [Bacteroidales bacterium]|nr:ribosome small subunit-dependent GTPase A [Bacteroidales bacterium]